MTKAEIIKALEPYDSNKQVYFTLPGTTQLYEIDEVNEQPYGNSPCFESLEAPSFEDICGMAGACFSEHKDHMTEFQKDLIVRIADGCYEEKMREFANEG